MLLIIKTNLQIHFSNYCWQSIHNFKNNFVVTYFVTNVLYSCNFIYLAFKDEFWTDTGCGNGERQKLICFCA